MDVYPKKMPRRSNSIESKVPTNKPSIKHIDFQNNDVENTKNIDLHYHQGFKSKDLENGYNIDTSMTHTKINTNSNLTPKTTIPRSNSITKNTYVNNSDSRKLINTNLNGNNTSNEIPSLTATPERFKSSIIRKQSESY